MSAFAILSGALAVLVGAWMISPALSLMVAGVLLAIIGLELAE